jgi:hypothetical protein
MNLRSQVLTFSQSEKIKSALIWISQCAETLPGLSPPLRQGAERMIADLVSMVLGEVHLIRRMTGDADWIEVEKHLDLALVMINSGVATEASYHAANGLTHVTAIGRRAMSALRDSGIL